MKLFRRPPDFIIGDPAAPYMRRWWIIPRNRFFNIYLHNIMRSDDDRALHDHPWWNFSFILKGGYWEWRPGWPKKAAPVMLTREFKIKEVSHAMWRGRFSMVLRNAEYSHRLELDPKTPACWSLFITGPRVREWGFHCPKGWISWRTFAGVPAGQEATGNEKGPGCE